MATRSLATDDVQTAIGSKRSDHSYYGRIYPAVINKETSEQNLWQR
jgi:hypothetical protein